MQKQAINKDERVPECACELRLARRHLMAALLVSYSFGSSLSIVDPRFKSLLEHGTVCETPTIQK